MRQVIYINQPEQKEEKPVEFTHILSVSDGWEKSFLNPNDFDKIVYLGKCVIDGDMFATYVKGSIGIHKGHINSGKY